MIDKRTWCRGVRSSLDHFIVKTLRFMAVFGNFSTFSASAAATSVDEGPLKTVIVVFPTNNHDQTLKQHSNNAQTVDATFATATDRGFHNSI